MKRVLPRGATLERSNPHLFRGIPKCPDCNNPSVRFLDRWVCRDCFDIGGGESVAFVFPNRAARRAARLARR